MTRFLLPSVLSVILVLDARGQDSSNAAPEIHSAFAIADGAGSPPREPEALRQFALKYCRFGLTLFPSTPLPGYPGANLAASNRPPWGYPQYQNYPDSIEHYRPDDIKYVPPLHPCNTRSLIRNFIAVDLDGVAPAAKETFAEPVVYITRWSSNKPHFLTGENRPPVSVVRLKPGGQRLKFDVGPLPIGLYQVRAIAALETKDVDPVDPRDLILDLTVNDGPNGETNHYALRQRATYNFYSQGEFAIHVDRDDKRIFHVDLGLHPESDVDLLVHNVDVHDLFAECARKAGKTQSILLDPVQLKESWKTPEAEGVRAKCGEAVQARLAAFRAAHPQLAENELYPAWRKERDDAIWNTLPPVNTHFFCGTDGLQCKVDPETERKFKEQGILFEPKPVDITGNAPFGWGVKGTNGATWRIDLPDSRPYPKDLQDFIPFRMVMVDLAHPTNTPLQVYTLEDLKALKPLPGLPIAVYPWGKRLAVGNGEDPAFFFPTVQAIHQNRLIPMRLLEIPYLRKLYEPYLKAGVDVSARDAALLLCRYAYDLPTYSSKHGYNENVINPKRNLHRYQANEDRSRNYQMFNWPDIAESYDHLFDYIKDNTELAEAVGRYVPWVKTPRDVRTLLETHVLQYGAKQAMYFKYYLSHEHAGMLTKLAAIQNNTEIATPWMESALTFTHEYPERVGRLMDFAYKSVQRDGTTQIGSYFYAKNGGITAKVQDWIEKAGGTIPDRYSLQRFSRVYATPYWFFESAVAGMINPGIGDVGGPYQGHGTGFNGAAYAEAGWRWTRDPRFAYLLANYGERGTTKPAEWAAIQKAAEGVRNPYMANRSRSLVNWFGVLEGGQASDDYRFRQAARVRVGRGWGHAHNDTLDLGLFAMGMTFAGDCGGRGGYNFPADGIHNTVTVDGRDLLANAWVTDLADMDACHYLRARADGRDLFVRQVGLIELDSGRPAAKPPSNPNLNPRDTKYDPDIVLPRAYVVDFFRVKGGKTHAYGFHGPPDDAFTATVTPRALSPGKTNLLKGYLLAGEQWGGTIGADTLTATWRMGRDRKTFSAERWKEQKTMAAPPAEPLMAGWANVNSNTSRKYLRMHMPGAKGQTFLTGVWVSIPYQVGRDDGMLYRQAHIIRNTENANLFAAVFEPYAGEPFIKTVDWEGAPDAPDRAAALHIATVDGIQDLCFADQPGGSTNVLKDGTKVQGQFAYLSRDAQGLRQACLTGGRLLETPGLKLMPDTDEWRGEVTTVDYAAQTVVLNKAFPAKLLEGSFFEVGRPADETRKLAERWTNFEAVKLEPLRGQTRLQWRKGADVGSALVESIALSARMPAPAIDLTLSGEADTDRGSLQLVATDGARKRQWRCCMQGNVATLYGDGVSASDWKPGDTVWIYELGVGEVFRAPSQVSLRRREPGVYRVTANTPFRLALPVQKVEWSKDGSAWTVLPPESGTQSWRLTEEHLIKPIWLRWSL